MSETFLGRYRILEPPDEDDILAMLRRLVHGEQPTVIVHGRKYAAWKTTATFPDLASVPRIDSSLEKLARFHASVDQAASGVREGAKLGAGRRERYAFTRRNLLSVVRFLRLEISRCDRKDATGAMRGALDRYYIKRVTAEDREVVLRLLDAAGIGMKTWALGAA